MAGSSPEQRSESERRSAADFLRTIALTGLAIVVPILISIYVLSVAAGFLGDFLDPVASIFVSGSEVGLLGQVLAIVVLLAIVLLVGLVTHFRAGEQAIDYVDAAIGRLPRIGTIYRSFRRMSDVMLEGEADHFRDVKLVQFPTDGSYALGFETAETHATIEAAAEEVEGMRTLFVPMAPNPFMGGFVLHVSSDRVRDVDISVAEGIRATVTSGVAMEADPEESALGGPAWELSDFERVPDLKRLRALGIDTAELRSIDVETLRSFRFEEIEDRLLTADREAETADDPDPGGSSEETPDNSGGRR